MGQAGSKLRLRNWKPYLPTLCNSLPTCQSNEPFPRPSSPSLGTGEWHHVTAPLPTLMTRLAVGWDAPSLSPCRPKTEGENTPLPPFSSLPTPRLNVFCDFLTLLHKLQPSHLTLLLSYNKCSVSDLYTSLQGLRQHHSGAVACRVFICHQQTQIVWLVSKFEAPVWIPHLLSAHR